MPFQKFPFALPQYFPSLQNEILARSSFYLQGYTDPPVPPEPLLGEPEGLQVLFSASSLRTLAAVRDLRAFLFLFLQ